MRENRDGERARGREREGGGGERETGRQAVISIDPERQMIIIIDRE